MPKALAPYERKMDDEMELFMAERRGVCRKCYEVCGGKCQEVAHIPVLWGGNDTPNLPPSPKKKSFADWLKLAGLYAVITWVIIKAIMELSQ